MTKNFFTERVIKHWKRLAREVVEAPFPKAFKRHRDAEPGGHGLVVELAVLG